MKADQRVQDRYTLVEALGRGGMAEVWLARDERLERHVAIKFMAANLTHDAEFLVRFFSEAQAVARISHPNVVAVLDFGEHQGRPYLVMEHVPGGTLSGLTGGNPMLPERAVEIVAGAARGAGAAHATGLVHRDVKPGNILLDDQGRPKLADFGIASSTMSENLTATGTAIGSPHYISPEQASGRTVGPASDVYSLGAVLYELLTGRPPFDGDNVTAIAIAHVEQPPVPPSTRVPGLPGPLDALVLSCLAKDPAARPPDGATLAEALETGDAAVTSFVPAAPVAAYDYYDDDLEPEPEVDPAPKRRLVPAVLALAVVIALAGAMYVSGRPDDVAEAGTEERETQAPSEATKRPKRQTPAPDATSAPAPAAPVATPAPTPTTEPDEVRTKETPEPEKKSRTPEPTREPTREPKPSDEPEPTPEPSEEPTAEPSQEPEPTPTPAPEPSGTG